MNAPSLFDDQGAAPVSLLRAERASWRPFGEAEAAPAEAPAPGPPDRACTVRAQTKCPTCHGWEIRPTSRPKATTAPGGRTVVTTWGVCSTCERYRYTREVTGP